MIDVNVNVNCRSNGAQGKGLACTRPEKDKARDVAGAGLVDRRGERAEVQFSRACSARLVISSTLPVPLILRQRGAWASPVAHQFS